MWREIPTQRDLHPFEHAKKLNTIEKLEKQTMSLQGLKIA